MGYLYVLSNAAMPGLLKIGHGPPERRARKLSAATGVPHPFQVVARWEVLKPRRAEAMVHRRLADYRVSNRREFFSISIEQARGVIDGILLELGEGRAVNPPRQDSRQERSHNAQGPAIPPRREPQRAPGRSRVQSVWSAIREDQRRLGWD